MLIILGGLPGAGKTTIAQALSKQIGATHLRIDTIEETIKVMQLRGEEVEKAGYLIAYEIAKDNLLLGNTVIADSVNSTITTRNAWQDVATSVDTPFIEVEIICFEREAHKKRIEQRASNMTWNDIQNCEYQIWDSCHLKIDTSKSSVKDCVYKIKQYLKLTA
jgi:predicted kinase